MKKIYLFLIQLVFLSYLSTISFAGVISTDITLPDSDNGLSNNDGLAAFFDLRDRETFIQITNNNESSTTFHVQIFNVSQNCNENDFFDVYTGNDTHVYNMRDIITNDTNPSGVILPQNSYGIVVVSAVDPVGGTIDREPYIGNFRIIDNNGYEYRTNLSDWKNLNPAPDNLFEEDLKFNFSLANGNTFSDIVGILLVQVNDRSEWSAVNVSRNFFVLDVDIYDLNENPLSCRDVVFSCVEPNSIFLDDILSYEGGDGGFFEGINGANTASFEYGINEAIPHSKGGELLCPGNNIGEGFTVLNIQGIAEPQESSGGQTIFNIFVGLNNGNGRGSIDAVWWKNNFVDN